MTSARMMIMEEEEGEWRMDDGKGGGGSVAILPQGWQ